ncbi:MAG: radical SAM protein [Myxococcales bacterium]|nr:radical SAM protein [Myxococcales bacterium]
MSSDVLQPPGRLWIHEVYASIQGESTFAGLPCVFVRTSRCNLRCRWCDTPQAFEGGSKLGVAELLDQVLAFGLPLVEVTGGEPLLQPEVHRLLGALCDAGLTVLLETSGERDIGGVDPRVRRIVDLKAPGSGECAKNRWENLELLTELDEVKFVLADRADYEWARARIREQELAQRVGAVLLSCVFGELDPSLLVSWVLADRLEARVQLQLHKHIWPPEQVGV